MKIMARRNQNGRFKKTTRRRSRKKQTNLTNLLVSGMVLNSITSNTMNSNLVEFVTGRVNGSYRPGSDGSTVITLPELLGAGPGGIGGNYSSGYSLGKVLTDNFKNNWMQLLTGVVIVPVAVRAVSKVIRKPVILPANRMLRSLDLGVKI